MVYTGPKLIELLSQQQQARGQADLMRQGTFYLQWRAKVGSYPHPDTETLVSAGEPCGAWQPSRGRPEAKRNLGENWEQLPKLPLNGYVPGSSIRGIVRAWVKARPDLVPRMQELLGYQDRNDEVYGGKIQFLDAYPTAPTGLSLDIVNPQQPFQVYHRQQGTPLSLYTLGDGDAPVELTVAICANSTRVTAAEVDEVWEWVEQALSLYGVGSRTASGYGAIARHNPRTSKLPNPKLDPGYSRKTLYFTLYSQGCYGTHQKGVDAEELRPSHWRGWLRSWLLRFLLGIMSEPDAEATLGELMGTLEPATQRGCLRLRLHPDLPDDPDEAWVESSNNQPRFYVWQGQLELSAPKDILNQLILPVVRIAASVGGVGRGWRRPLHIFTINNGRDAARGSHLVLTHSIKNQQTQKQQRKSFGLHPNKPQLWARTYQTWLAAAQQQWPQRVRPGCNDTLAAEVFSPTTCAIYTVPGPDGDPLDRHDPRWQTTNPLKTRGEAMQLIYQPDYKRQPELGGDAGRGQAHCSWASIRRIRVPNQDEGTDCQETVCLFLGGQPACGNGLRSRFLQDLARKPSHTHLFGLRP